MAVSDRHAPTTRLREVALARVVHLAHGMIEDAWDEESTSEYPTLSTARVLVAEDDPELRELVASRLRREGCDVVEVASGDDALEQIAGFAMTGLELAILDVRMPGMSGLEVVYMMRTWALDTPVLIVTAFPEPMLLEECERLGVPVLQKPFALHRISSAARAVLRGDEVMP